MTFNAFDGRQQGGTRPKPLARMSRWRAPDHGAVDGGPFGQRRSLQLLAQEYSAKLQQAGYSVMQGITALQQAEGSGVRKTAASTAVAAEIQALEDVAHKVFGGDAAHWLLQPNHLLGGHTPKSLMLAPSGRAKVQQLLKAYALAA